MLNNFVVIQQNLNNKHKDLFLNHTKHFQIQFINILFVIE